MREGSRRCRMAPPLRRRRTAEHPPTCRCPRPAACRRLQGQKQQMRAQLDLASKARDSARSSMKELKSSLKFTKGAWPAGVGGWATVSVL